MNNNNKKTENQNKERRREQKKFSNYCLQNYQVRWNFQAIKIIEKFLLKKGNLRKIFSTIFS